MPLLSRLSILWRKLFHKARTEQELTEEIDAYLEMLIDLKIREGLDPEEARRVALIELGGKEQVKEKVRQAGAGYHLETLWLDIRYGLRMLLKKDPGEQRPLPLNDLITEMVSVVHHNAVFRNIAVDLDLADGLPRVEGDRIQLQQVLLNLVVNGFEAMSEVGDRPRKLVLRTRLLDEKQVLVNVIDNGTGIAADKLDSIFEPFYTTKKSGMGMGLSVSRSIGSAIAPL